MAKHDLIRALLADRLRRVYGVEASVAASVAACPGTGGRLAPEYARILSDYEFLTGLQPASSWCGVCNASPW